MSKSKNKAATFPLVTNDNGSGDEEEEDDDDFTRIPYSVADMSPADMSSFGKVDMSSWRTNDGESLTQYDYHQPFVPPPPGVHGCPPPFGPPWMPPWAGMQPGMPGMPPPWAMPPNGMPPLGPNGMPLPSDDTEAIEAHAAMLERQATQLREAARQAELRAQTVKRNHDVFGGHMPALPTGLPTPGYFPDAGYDPAVIAEPMWGPAVGKSTASGKKDNKPKKDKTENASSSKVPAASSAAPQVAEGDRTTIMLRNIPNNYTREMVCKLLDDQGFQKKYDFVYLPMDFHRMAGLGYAFVNLVSNEAAKKAMSDFDGFTEWTLASKKVCEVSWGEPLQGLEAHIERYRNSPVMHEEVNEKYKPILLKDGVMQVFPPPTKKIRPPRVKRTCTGNKDGEGNDDGGDGPGDGGHDD